VTLVSLATVREAAEHQRRTFALQLRLTASVSLQRSSHQRANQSNPMDRTRRCVTGSVGVLEFLILAREACEGTVATNVPFDRGGRTSEINLGSRSLDCVIRLVPLARLQPQHAAICVSERLRRSGCGSSGVRVSSKHLRGRHGVAGDSCEQENESASVEMEEHMAVLGGFEKTCEHRRGR
jgi:hypothetical protein